MVYLPANSILFKGDMRKYVELQRPGLFLRIEKLENQSKILYNGEKWITENSNIREVNKTW